MEVSRRVSSLRRPRAFESHAGCEGDQREESLLAEVRIERPRRRAPCGAASRCGGLHAGLGARAGRQAELLGASIGRVGERQLSEIGELALECF